MEYRYCARSNFEDYAGGRVIRHKAGMTNFPVRLSQEIFQRCLYYLKRQSNLCLYDPCCGSGYMLTVLGLINRPMIGKIAASDISPEAIEATRANLSLLSGHGLRERMTQLEVLYGQYHKASHLEAMKSAAKLLDQMGPSAESPDLWIRQLDIQATGSLEQALFQADIVITDVPYGQLVSWGGAQDNPVSRLLINLQPVLKPDSVVAICSDKSQKTGDVPYRRLERQNVGKRKFELFKPVHLSERKESYEIDPF